MNVVLIKRGNLDTQRERQVKMKAEIGVMHQKPRNIKDGQKNTEARGCKEDILYCSLLKEPALQTL